MWPCLRTFSLQERWPILRSTLTTRLAQMLVISLSPTSHRSFCNKILALTNPSQRHIERKLFTSVDQVSRGKWLSSSRLPPSITKLHLPRPSASMRQATTLSTLWLLKAFTQILSGAWTTSSCTCRTRIRPSVAFQRSSTTSRWFSTRWCQVSSSRPLRYLSTRLELSSSCKLLQTLRPKVKLFRVRPWILTTDQRRKIRSSEASTGSLIFKYHS